MKKKDLLNDGEKGLLLAKLHYIIVLNGLFWAVLLLACSMVIPHLFVNSEHAWEHLRSSNLLYYSHHFLFSDTIVTIEHVVAILAEVILITFGLSIFIYSLVAYCANFVIISDNRIIYKKGLIFLKIREVEIEEIKEANLDFGIFGRMLGYAKIHIDARFVKDLFLPPMRKPYEFMKVLHTVHDTQSEKIVVTKNLNKI